MKRLILAAVVFVFCVFPVLSEKGEAFQYQTDIKYQPSETGFSYKESGLHHPLIPSTGNVLTRDYLPFVKLPEIKQLKICDL